jgi:hypothetical protein
MATIINHQSNNNPWDAKASSSREFAAAFLEGFRQPVRSSIPRAGEDAKDAFCTEFAAAINRRRKLAVARSKAQNLALLVSTEPMLPSAALARAEDTCSCVPAICSSWTPHTLEMASDCVGQLACSPCVEASWSEQQGLKQAARVLQSVQVIHKRRPHEQFAGSTRDVKQIAQRSVKS